jgi:hypothetical protein
MKNTILILLTLLSHSVFAEVIINGYCDFPKATISVFEIEDCITKKERKISETEVDDKGNFRLIFSSNDIKKIILRVNSNFTWMYIQPNSTYFIDIPKDGQITQFITNNEIEMVFFRLASDDINYKILGFEAWMDNYLSDIYILKDKQPGEFVQKIAAFKKEVNDVYSKDTSLFFSSYLKYSIGLTIDNINFISAPSEADKFEFYIKDSPILINNNKYIEYLYSFYENYYYKLDQNLRAQLNTSIRNYDLENCLQTLKKDPYIQTEELAELILLMMINQSAFSQEISKNILNKIYEKSINENHSTIAKNLLLKADEINIGDIFPNLILDKKSQYNLQMLKGKPIYIHCFDPKNQKSITEISALLKLNEKYEKYINIISVYSKPKEDFSMSEQRNLNLIKWKKFELEPSEKSWKILNIPSFPYYLFLDKDLVLLASPALSPSPNGSYETIERSFYDIKRKIEQIGE